MFALPRDRRCKKYNCGALRPCTRGQLSLFAQRKLTERNAPPSRHPREHHARVPCAPHRSRTLAQLAEREQLALRARTRSSESLRERLRCSAGSTGPNCNCAAAIVVRCEIFGRVAKSPTPLCGLLASSADGMLRLSRLPCCSQLRAAAKMSTCWSITFFPANTLKTIYPIGDLKSRDLKT